MEHYVAEAIRNRQIAEDWERVNPGKTAHVFTATDEGIAATEICGETDPDDGWEPLELRDWFGIILAAVTLCGLFYYFLFVVLLGH